MNETETETEAQVALYGAARLRSGASELRGDLLGAKPGPVPADRGGQPPTVGKFVLAGLANPPGLAE